MPGAYSTFDTLSLELGESDPFGLVNSGGSLPVLARIPRIEISGPQGTHSHVEAAHEVVPPPKMSPASLADSFFAIDTLTADAQTPDAVAPAKQATRSANPPAPKGPTPEAPPLYVPTTASDRVLSQDSSPAADPSKQQDDWPSALLQLEAIIAPYSQLIVLLTLILAAGLTMLLFRTGPTKVQEGVDSPTAGAAAFAEAQPTPINAAPAPQAIATVSEPTGQPGPALQPPTIAKGPGAMARSQAVRPLEPHREPAGTGEPAPQVAQSAAPTKGYPTTGESDGPVARLSGLVLPQPQRQQTK